MRPHQTDEVSQQTITILSAHTADQYKRRGIHYFYLLAMPADGLSQPPEGSKLTTLVVRLNLTTRVVKCKKGTK